MTWFPRLSLSVTIRSVRKTSWTLVFRVSLGG
jgi:hypothetical protein